MTTNHLLLLHGALGSQAQLAALKQHLSDSYQVHTLDFEGHGDHPSDEAFSMERFADNVRSFLAEQGIQRTHIFGYSMGGYVALCLALHSPELVERIVTFGTKFDWTVETANKEVKMLNPAVIEAKVPQFAAHLKAVHPASDWKAVLDKTAAMMLALGQAPPLTSAALSQIGHPVLIGVGDQDNMVSIEESQATVARLQDGHLTLLEGFKHPLEKNDLAALAQVIQGFIAADNA